MDHSPHDASGQRSNPPPPRVSTEAGKNAYPSIETPRGNTQAVLPLMVENPWLCPGISQPCVSHYVKTARRIKSHTSNFFVDFLYRGQGAPYRTRFQKKGPHSPWSPNTTLRLLGWPGSAVGVSSRNGSSRSVRSSLVTFRFHLAKAPAPDRSV